MKKMFSTLFLVLIFNASVMAQMNKTFYLSGFSFSQNHALAIKENFGEDDGIFWACDFFVPAPPYFSNETAIVKTDFNGNIIRERALEHPYSTLRLREATEGVLFAGEYQGEVHLVFLDDNLNIIWSRKIQNGNYFYVSPPAKIDILRHFEDDGQEVFYISFPGQSEQEGYQNSDQVLCLLKVTSNGDLVWFNKYHDLNRTDLASLNIADVPNAMIFFENSETGQGNIAITGMRRDDVSQNEHLFFIAVDLNGQISVQYKRYTLIRPFLSDIAWDGANFVNTFIEGSSVFPFGVAMVGVMKLDPFLGFVDGRYFATQCENYGLGITVDPTDGDYVVSTFTGECQNGGYGCGLFKVDPNFNLSYFKRYNYDSYVRPSDWHITGLDGKNYWVATTEPQVPSATANIRLYVSDPNGEVCGAVDDWPSVDEITPDVTDYSYFEMGIDLFEEYSVHIRDIKLEEDYCEESLDPNTYKIVGDANEDFYSIYPTFLKRGETINLDVMGVYGDHINVRVVDFLGKVIYKNRFELNGGKTTLKIPSSMNTGLLNVLVEGHFGLKSTKVLIQ